MIFKHNFGPRRILAGADQLGDENGGLKGAEIVDERVVFEAFHTRQNDRDSAPSRLEDSLHAALREIGSILVQIGPIGAL